jgi:hypothetical protein
MLEDTKRLIGRKTHNSMVKEEMVKMINNDLLQLWYLQTVLAIYSKSSQWFHCHLGADCPFGAP